MTKTVHPLSDYSESDSSHDNYDIQNFPLILLVHVESPGNTLPEMFPGHSFHKYCWPLAIFIACLQAPLHIQ